METYFDTIITEDYATSGDEYGYYNSNNDIRRPLNKGDKIIYNLADSVHSMKSNQGSRRLPNPRGTVHENQYDNGNVIDRLSDLIEITRAFRSSREGESTSVHDCKERGINTFQAVDDHLDIQKSRRMENIPHENINRDDVKNLHPPTDDVDNSCNLHADSHKKMLRIERKDTCPGHVPVTLMSYEKDRMGHYGNSARDDEAASFQESLNNLDDLRRYLIGRKNAHHTFERKVNTEETCWVNDRIEDKPNPADSMYDSPFSEENVHSPNENFTHHNDQVKSIHSCALYDKPSRDKISENKHPNREDYEDHMGIHASEVPKKHSEIQTDDGQRQAVRKRGRSRTADEVSQISPSKPSHDGFWKDRTFHLPLEYVKKLSWISEKQLSDLYQQFDKAVVAVRIPLGVENYLSHCDNEETTVRPEMVLNDCPPACIELETRDLIENDHRVMENDPFPQESKSKKSSKVQYTGEANRRHVGGASFQDNISLRYQDVASPGRGYGLLDNESIRQEKSKATRNGDYEIASDESNSLARGSYELYEKTNNVGNSVQPTRDKAFDSRQGSVENLPLKNDASIDNNALQCEGDNVNTSINSRGNVPPSRVERKENSHQDCEDTNQQFQRRNNKSDFNFDNRCCAEENQKYTRTCKQSNLLPTSNPKMSRCVYSMNSNFCSDCKEIFKDDFEFLMTSNDYLDIQRYLENRECRKQHSSGLQKDRTQNLDLNEDNHSLNHNLIRVDDLSASQYKKISDFNETHIVNQKSFSEFRDANTPENANIVIDKERERRSDPSLWINAAPKSFRVNDTINPYEIDLEIGEVGSSSEAVRQMQPNDFMLDERMFQESQPSLLNQLNQRSNPTPAHPTLTDDCYQREAGFFRNSLSSRESTMKSYPSIGVEESSFHGTSLKNESLNTKRKGKMSMREEDLGSNTQECKVLPKNQPHLKRDSSVDLENSKKQQLYQRNCDFSSLCRKLGDLMNCLIRMEGLPVKNNPQGVKSKRKRSSSAHAKMPSHRPPPYNPPCSLNNNYSNTCDRLKTKERYIRVEMESESDDESWSSSVVSVRCDNNVVLKLFKEFLSFRDAVRMLYKDNRFSDNKEVHPSRTLNENNNNAVSEVRALQSGSGSQKTFFCMNTMISNVDEAIKDKKRSIRRKLSNCRKLQESWEQLKKTSEWCKMQLDNEILTKSELEASLNRLLTERNNSSEISESSLTASSQPPSISRTYALQTNTSGIGNFENSSPTGEEITLASEMRKNENYGEFKENRSRFNVLPNQEFSQVIHELGDGMDHANPNAPGMVYAKSSEERKGKTDINLRRELEDVIGQKRKILESLKEIEFLHGHSDLNGNPVWTKQWETGSSSSSSDQSTNDESTTSSSQRRADSRDLHKEPPVRGFKKMIDQLREIQEVTKELLHNRDQILCARDECDAPFCNQTVISELGKELMHVRTEVEGLWKTKVDLEEKLRYTVDEKVRILLSLADMREKATKLEIKEVEVEQELRDSMGKNEHLRNTISLITSELSTVRLWLDEERRKVSELEERLSGTSALSIELQERLQEIPGLRENLHITREKCCDFSREVEVLRRRNSSLEREIEVLRRGAESKERLTYEDIQRENIVSSSSGCPHEVHRLANDPPMRHFDDCNNRIPRYHPTESMRIHHEL